jgi:23S rRNA (uracil1939-C5)-methyltransferase
MPRRRGRRKPPPDLPPITVRIDSLVFGGQGLGHLEDGRVALVSFAAPGELVEATIERDHTDYVQAVTTRVIEASPDRVEPPCSLFGRCGGCQLQHMAYPAQLAAKKHVVEEQLRRIGRLEGVRVDDTVAGNPWGYRNHIRLSTGPTHGDVGFISRHGRGLLTVNECPIAHPFINALLPQLQHRCKGLHQVQIRYNESTGSHLIKPEIEGLDIPSGQTSYVERLGGRSFVVSDSAFFQVNTPQAERLVELVGEALPERGGLLIDAFAGVGTFAVIFANRFRHVIAIEESVSATKDAKANIHETPNIRIQVGKVEEVLPAIEDEPDAIILDPPRAGCAPPVLQAVARLRPRVVAYVSCNPATLARDLRALVDGGYRIERVTPVDMFPQTGHIESVTHLVFAGEASA